MAPLARTGEPSLVSMLPLSLMPPGLDRGVVSARRMEDSSLGVLGVIISDIVGDSRCRGCASLRKSCQKLPSVGSVLNVRTVGKLCL